MIKKLLKTSVIAVVAAMFTFSASVSANQQIQVLMTTNMGEITLALDPDKAPVTVKNFLRYVDEGYYDGTIYHRVISDFMIQGGGFDQAYEKKSTHENIINESDNGLPNERGTIAMARTNAPHTASTQFFINVVDNNFLNHTPNNTGAWGYAVFGKVIKGMDVVDRIQRTKTGRGGPFPSDVPKKMVIIEKMSRIEQ